jgi:hypothetical protein
MAILTANVQVTEVYRDWDWTYVLTVFFFLAGRRGGGGFRDMVSLYSPGCPGTHFVDQAGLELRKPPATASQVLGLKACTTTSLKVLELARYQSSVHFCLFTYQ